jgi:hypothetical protein
LNLHLNSDQINELLQADKPGKTADRESLSDVQKHLRDCGDCQTRMRALEQANAQLAFLRSDNPGAKGAMCPPDDVWQEMAAGIACQGSEIHLSHAAQCDYCGPLLRRMKEDFADELTLDEEIRIAGLQSATTDWQKRFVVKLTNTQGAPPAISPPGDRSSFRGVFPPAWRLAVAGAILGLILLGIRDHRRTVSLSAQNLRGNAEIERLKQSNFQQSKQIAELTAGLEKSGTPAASREPQPAANSHVAALVLDPGLTRGIESLKRLTVPHGTDVAKVTLRLLESPDGVVREDLLTAGGQKKWSQELIPAESAAKSNSLSLWLPAYLLTPNDYQLVLSRESADGFEKFATYSFRVTR